MHRPFFFLVPLICLSSALWAAPATVNVEVLQDKLDHPWSLAFLPDNHGMLITLRGGELRHWQAGKGLSAPFRSAGRLGARAGRPAGRGFSA
ncbi:aldose sugar dehydrogenase [Escherichia coli]|nr:aldose sugar dehydrogenase [Escherichia coli]